MRAEVLDDDLSALRDFELLDRVQALQDAWSLSEQRIASGDAAAIARRTTLAWERFAVASEPFRHRRSALRDLDEAAGGPDIQAAARSAQFALVDELLGHPWRPVPTTIGSVASNIDRLVFATDSRSDLLVLAIDNTDARQRTTALGIAAHLYLPRFDLVRLVAALRRSKLIPTWQWISATATLVLLFMAALSPFVVSSRSLLDAASWLGLAGVAAAFFTAFQRRVGLGWLLCLRLPASSAIGLAGLAAINPDWMERSSGPWWIAATLGAFGIVGYFALEAREHGADTRRALSGGLLVGILGLVYSMAAANLSIRYVLPALYNTDAANPFTPLVGRAVALSGVASLFVGVLLQVMWDDRPITAPLSHLARPLEVEP